MSRYDDPERMAYIREIIRHEFKVRRPLPADRKRCPSCEQAKPRSEFSRNAARPDGLQSTCKECQRKP
jgi:hypothetical protein